MFSPGAASRRRRRGGGGGGAGGGAASAAPEPTAQSANGNIGFMTASQRRRFDAKKAAERADRVRAATRRRGGHGRRSKQWSLSNWLFG